MDFFPTEFTFWTVLYWIFVFFLVCYIGFQIYIYVYDLEYEIDCENNDRCFVIYEKGDRADDDTESTVWNLMYDFCMTSVWLLFETN